MTENHASEEATIKGHNLRLAKMMTWTHTNYPAYFRQGVVKLTRAQISDAPKYYKCTHDFLYNKINVDIVKAFISSGKVKATKEDGEEIYYSYDHLRKYKDAVLFGAKRQKVKLGDNFKVQMEAFMDSLKKENQKAKKNGQCTEQEADPITFPLYREICRKAIATGNIFLWVFTVCQWNCMARSINIDNLRFNCLSLGKDSLVVKYWDTKKDKKGEKTSPKNCYANPFEYEICIYTALGTYFCIYDENFVGGQKATLFLSNGSKEGSASHKYCDQLTVLFKSMQGILEEHIRPGHANAHGTRKGSAVEATSGTTCPPPPSSVARRGEWSMGKIFDIYWLFAQAGDQYLGRILAGLDPNTPEFATLPPHFKEGIENENIVYGMKRCFPSIITLNDEETRKNMTGLLMRYLASIFWHSEVL